ncbi:MAG: trypsin-like peptidase domain-containing protein [Flavobacteriales bacterium]|nr:trypsin-like peptidase domain-containing protein [Flavobacteriales bacterium]
MLFCILSFSYSRAQVSYGGEPLTWSNDKINWHIGYAEMPEFDVDAMLAEDEITNQYKNSPYRFAKNFYPGLNLDNAGYWHELPNGDRVWLMSVRSPGAYTLNLGFDLFYIPEGGKLFIYTPDHEQLIGAFDHRNNNADQELGTWPLAGDELIIEYYEPASHQGETQLQIGRVSHDYRDIEKVARGLGDSGSCNNNVVCPEGDPWSNEINAVAMIVVSGSGICTGSLINNAANDGHPYFMTANHCLGGSVASWSFRFNWQSTTCVGNTVGSFDTVSGATLLSSGAGSDYALLEINNGNPIPTAYNPYYAGWDATGTTPTNQTCIHHPSGDIKKISFDNNSAGSATWGGATTWRIFTWEDGTTEPGSSGSPLYDQNHRYIGQLYGGTASCSNNIDDYFGKFSVTYPNICAWIDPSCSAGVLDGYDPNTPTSNLDAQVLSISAPTGTICGNSITPQVVVRNAGTTTITSFTLQYNVDGGANQTYAWTGPLASGNTTTVTLPAIAVAGGSHTFNATVLNPNGGTDENNANDSGSSPFVMVAGGGLATVNITTDCWGSEVTWTITDGGGTQLYAGGPYTDSAPNGGGTISTDVCLADGCYDFNIFDAYGDGMYGSQWGSCSVNGDYNITDVGGNIVLQMTAVNADYGTGTTDNFCLANATSGCMDSAACNYNSSATTDDGSCVYPGCTNPAACNYDSTAGCDDGSCQTAGCTTLTACNYNASASCDDGSCTFPGCTDSAACNYNPAAGCFDGSCEYVSCQGCTDTAACNYDSTATVDNGSCTYPGCTDSAACNYNGAAGCDDGSCTYPGCMDTTACNFDIAAACDDGSCTYPGCTDNAACNYDSTAGCSDGSCIYPGCTDSTACNFDSTAGCDDGSCEFASCSCPGDFNNSGHVEVSDLLFMLGDFGCVGTCVCDLNNDGGTDTSDMLLFLGYYGNVCP